MTIDQIKEKKEELESDIQRLLMVFEKDTKVKVNEVILDTFELSMMGRNEVLRDLKVKLKIEI